jgi:hypothetical protein
MEGFWSKIIEKLPVIPEILNFSRRCKVLLVLTLAKKGNYASTFNWAACEHWCKWNQEQVSSSDNHGQNLRTGMALIDQNGCW